MKPLKHSSWSGRIQSFTPPASIPCLLASLLVASFLFQGFSATNVVTSLADDGPGSLRQALVAATGGDTIVFAGGGTIALTSGELVIAKDLNLIGPGASLLTISGNHQSRVFKIVTNVNARIVGLTISAGQTGSGQPGGGIANSGTLTLMQCIISGNATGAGANGDSYKIYGGSGGAGGNGGGLFNEHAVTLIECSVNNNSCGNGGMGGFGQVGGGSGGNGGWGGGAYSSGRQIALIRCTIANNHAGSGGTGGSSSASPSSGGWGGFGGGIYSEWSLAATNCTVAGNAAGYGGAGGLRTSVPFGEAGYGSGGYGGGVSAGTNSYIIACTIAGNVASVADTGDSSKAGGIHLRGDGTTGGLLDSIVAQNTGRIPDVAGAFRSLGHNLIGITNGSSGFSSGGDMAGSSSSPLDPQLASLADNGGRTTTMALLPGSPAINRGTAIGAPETDQRGIPRPQGTGVDIGAYEFQFAIPQITEAKFLPASNFWFCLCGLPHETYTVQASSNLQSWSDITTLLTGANGSCEFVHSNVSDSNMRFFRLKSSAQ